MKPFVAAFPRTVARGSNIIGRKVARRGASSFPERIIALRCTETASENSRGKTPTDRFPENRYHELRFYEPRFCEGFTMLPPIRGPLTAAVSVGADASVSVASVSVASGSSRLGDGAQVLGN